MVQRIRALGLISGGLDSTLASRLLIEQGIDVRGVYFSTGFCLSDPDTKQKKGQSDSTNLCHEALKVGEDLRFAVEMVDVSEEYLTIVTNPRWGYGKNANPCIDCRIMMLRKAREMMDKLKANFIFTGEVIGQRPMTQHRSTMRQIEKQSGLDGLLLRPLSALKLPETEAEKNHWIDRTQLKGFTGRTRKPQMRLAEEMGLTSYPQPAGGCCYLTDPSYGRKFLDFVQHMPVKSEITHEDIELLKLGRHLRISRDLKIVVGRNEAENNSLETFRSGRWALTAIDVVGPIALVDGDILDADLEIAAKVLARYSDGRDSDMVRVRCQKSDSEKIVYAEPLHPEETARYIFR